MATDGIVESSGNVFADLGVGEPDAHLLKAELVRKLAEVMKSRGLTQSAAARIIGISQPDLSRAFRGSFRELSSDRLIRALTRLDSQIDIIVRQQGKPVGEPIHLGAALA